MGEQTAIAWTDHTFNAWEGCSRVSPGCTNCYAEARAHRYQHDVWGKTAPRMLRSDSYWNDPVKWDAAAAERGRPALVFCSSLADVYEDHQGPMVNAKGEVVEGRSVAAERARLFALIDRTPNLIWQLLTKRPENIGALSPPAWWGADEHGMVQVDETHRVPLRFATPTERRALAAQHWPRNVWNGTTTEDQVRADERIPALLAVGCPVPFLSAEPLLGEVDIRAHLWTPVKGYGPTSPHRRRREGIAWVIVGGESGNGYRAMDEAHARFLQQQCTEARVPLFFKQWGGRRATDGGNLLDGRLWQEFPPEAGDRTAVAVALRT